MTLRKLGQIYIFFIQYFKMTSITFERVSMSKMTLKKIKIMFFVCTCKSRAPVCFHLSVHCNVSGRTYLFFFCKSGGDAYIRDGPGRPYAAGTDRSELSITPSSLDSSTKTKWQPQLHIILQK